MVAVLDDGTISGDTKVGQSFLNLRKGKRDRLRIILPILKKAIDSKAEVTIDQIFDEIDKIPYQSTDYYIQSGAHGITEVIFSKLQDSLQGGIRSANSSRQILGQIYSEYSQLLMKLEAK